ncbi:hypothetical protein [Francisella philomiragia]|uniref:hypothetical protein n=1 Tax=Francisella philomiragia TaxID=28110 RepID=UPI001907FCB9|nr:hypothetical protein [Francisella philomiragia]MBK2268293.1 hypothetical protein [Francisella philomiragia]MBK2279712.1 hypothetical protein [Francisella philomiragia]MBK2287604.1 hypothetical protein [Francisella philomiragia]MBK2289583.1 hypothetical protein [Francisella philomiragia]MBK2291481.1 hypothetical protein [Francisella philomiragia]
MQKLTLIKTILGAISLLCFITSYAETIPEAFLKKVNNIYYKNGQAKSDFILAFCNDSNNDTENCYFGSITPDKSKPIIHVRNLNILGAVLDKFTLNSL